MNEKSAVLETPTGPPAESRGATILIVEDSAVQAELLRHALEGAGYTVIVARDGSEGLTQASARHPAAIVSDINMPVMDGYTMCQELRREPSLRHIPVILLTMLSDAQDVIHGLNAGADAYLTKPYNIPALISRIESLLAHPPAPPPATERRKVEVLLAGETFLVEAHSPRMLNLLISTYENAVLQNRELAATRGALEEINQHLEQNVLEKTAELRQSEQRFRALLENGSDLLIVMDAHGKITYASPSIKRVGGYEPRELLGRGMYELIHPDDLATALTDLSALVSNPGRLHVAQLRYRRKTGDWIVLETVAKSAIDDPSVAGVVINARDITARIRAEATLRNSEKDLREAQRIARIGSWDWDAAGDALTWSKEYYHIFGLDPAQRPPGYVDRLAAYTPESAARLDAAVKRSTQTGEPYELDLELARTEGPPRWITARSETKRDAQGRITGLRGTAQDISERKQSEQALKQANRALQTLSACNLALVRAGSESELLDSICRLIVETGGYRMAWVGFPEQDPTKMVRAVAQYGHDEGYLAAANISWADTERGRSPTGTAIRTGSIQINRDFLTNPALAPWREAATERGYRSSIALPLKSSAGASAVLTIYAAESNAFNEVEVTLLRELADDLAYGIETLRTRAERDRITQEHLHHTEILRQSLEDSIEAIAGTVEARDPYTAGHQRRVGELAGAISRELGLPEETIHGVELAARIHDLGKISVPAEILSKPTKLTDIEFKLIQNHAQAGYDILKDIKYPWPIATIVLQHHERLDGSGYPQGLKGDQILRESRIMAVADVVEAMSSHRPYRAALGIAPALEEIERGRDSIYDAAVADACIRLFAHKRFAFAT